MIVIIPPESSPLSYFRAALKGDPEDKKIGFAMLPLERKAKVFMGIARIWLNSGVDCSRLG